MIKQLGWLIGLSAGLLMVSVLTFPGKENHQRYIEKQLEKIEVERQILTEKELKLKEMAIQKEWEEVDNDNNK